ncbi:MAG: tRNA (guanine-N(7)-)-methyltransferase [Thermotogales bacterium 46_20]|nr:MAG: tRNA (guanine-N(7)-)-methyltransferase [Thermotogales bacterium 46_20]
MPVSGIQYFIDIREVGIPFLPGDLFGDKRDVFLEIGFGRGEFLENLATTFPNSGFLGVEMSLTSVRKLLDRISRTGIENVRVILADASFLIRHVFSSSTFAGIYMNFPCPWPKRKHARHRLSREMFINGVARVLTPGGFFQVTTDSQNFLEEVVTSLSESACFSKALIERNPGPAIGTKYEKKWKAEQRDIFRMTVSKVLPPKNCETLRSDEMPHTKIPSSAFSPSLLHKVTTEPVSKEQFTIIYKSIYTCTDKNEYLVDTVTNENGFEQRFFIKLVEGPEELLIKLFSSGLPFRTEAVKASVMELALLIRDHSINGFK